MSDFQIGDRVRILDSNNYSCFRVGDIKKIVKIGDGYVSLHHEDYIDGLAFYNSCLERVELSRESLPEKFRFKVRSRKHLRNLIPLFNEIGIYLHSKEDLQDQINDVLYFQKHHWIKVNGDYLNGNITMEEEEISTEQIDMILGLS